VKVENIEHENTEGAESTTEKTDIVNESGPYNPFHRHVEDEMQEVYLRLYDDTYQKYMEEAEFRVAYQLALAYFRDANPLLGSILNEFNGRDIVLLDKEDKNNINGIHLIFTKNCLRHLNVTAEEFEDIQLSQTQTLILSDDLPLSEVSLKKLSNFIQSGGLVLSYNKAISILERALPTLIKVKKGETIKDKSIEVQVTESEDKDLLLGLENAALRHKVVRYQGTRRFQALDSTTVAVLAQETGVSPFPVAIKAKFGQGLVFHISPLGTNEVLETRSKEKTQTYCKQVESAPNISEQTKQMWKSAFSCGHHNSFFLAISLLPFLDFVFGVIKKYRRG